MKIISYSDLHLEFGVDFKPPATVDSDVMILAGDIITFRDYKPLSRLLDDWKKPVLFVPGNHEYYHAKPIEVANAEFQDWLSSHYPNAHLLLNEAIDIGCVHFFGGTMWTNFLFGNQLAISAAQSGMNDFSVIKETDRKKLTPLTTIQLHNRFVDKLRAWFQQYMPSPSVVVTHHAPVLNPNSKYNKSPLLPAFNSLDMEDEIDRFQPDLWIYGHTHERDDHMLGKTRIISNPRGYPNEQTGKFECPSFDEGGSPIILGA